MQAFRSRPFFPHRVAPFPPRERPHAQSDGPTPRDGSLLVNLETAASYHPGTALTNPSDYLPLADFRAEFHDLRDQTGYTACLDPNSYAASQSLGAELLSHGSSGIVYPSVRRSEGTCIACFRPVLVINVRRDDTYIFVFPDAQLYAHHPARLKREQGERFRKRCCEIFLPGRACLGRPGHQRLVGEAERSFNRIGRGAALEPLQQDLALRVISKSIDQHRIS